MFYQCNQFAESLSTMAARVLLILCQFRRATFAIGNIKKRIVPEAAVALTIVKYLASPFTFSKQGLAARFDKRRYTVESSGAINNAFKLRQQLVVIRFVVAIRACESCRVDARCSVKRVDSQSGIICYSGQPRCIRSVSCFDQ